MRILHAARVLTPDAAPLAPGTVVIDGSRIGWVGPPDQISPRWAAAGATRIQLPEATLMPGLIDAHVHLAFADEITPAAALEAADRREVTATICTALRHALRAGITTVRDLGAPHYADRDALAQPGARPRVLTATIPLTVAGGHCDGLGGTVTEPGDIDRIVATNAAHGADWIKVMVTGGFTTGGRSSPTSRSSATPNSTGSSPPPATTDSPSPRTRTAPPGSGKPSPPAWTPSNTAPG
ncbi:hypothetical protein Ntsu_80230 [Nocardia sp. IFM 10818]